MTELEAYKKGYLEGLKKAVELFRTHDEGFGQYCDTGGDGVAQRKRTSY